MKGNYWTLDSNELVETVASLEGRIHARFPEASLSRLATDLKTITEGAAGEVERINKPHLPLRIGIAFLILAIGTVLVFLVMSLKVGNELPNAYEFIQILEAGLNCLVFIGAAILFLFTLEIFFRRNRVLAALHKLRSLAHVVDMHQLAKDPTPEDLADNISETSSHEYTPEELDDYLDYCSDLLSLISKMGSLYVLRFSEPSALAAVDQIESLTTGLIRKIWQKRVILAGRLDKIGSKRQS